MGNVPSTPSNGTPQSRPRGSSAPLPSSSATSAQPIASSSGVGASTQSSSTFHSGLTPPTRTPSPECPPTPPLLPYGGHLSPQNPHALVLPQALDYSKTVVSQLIMEARLAPFYRGLEEYEESFTENDIERLLNQLREKDYEEDVPNSVTAALKAERGAAKKPRSPLEIDKAERERRAYLGAIECPICFLNYPSNINTSRCCQQPICTECFVQMKRSEPSMTHLESEPACCPFCVETDFGVIYERPTLAAGPNPGDSSFSAVSMSEDTDAMVGAAPKAQETIRRKSVSHTAKEVVTIDEIRPDWEDKLNAVKAAAARKAARRIVMRQVGDRLVPIGFTSSRATGTADFSMSTGASARRDRRRGSGRDLEELMIMEAMRLSMLDQDENLHRQVVDGSNEGNPGSDTNSPASSSAPTPVSILQSGSSSPRRSERRKFSLPIPNSASTSGSRRSSDASPFRPKHEKGGSTASKILSKISGNRSRSGSNASHVSFSPTNQFIDSENASSRTSLPTVLEPAAEVTTAAPPRRASLASSTPSPISPVAPSPLSAATVAPAVTTVTSLPAAQTPSPENRTEDNLDRETGSEMPGLPRLSLDMAPLPLDHPTIKAPISHTERAPLARADTGLSELTVVPASYAQLDSDDEE